MFLSLIFMVPGIAVVALLQKGKLRLRKAKSLAPAGMKIAATIYSITLCLSGAQHSFGTH